MFCSRVLWQHRLPTGAPRWSFSLRSGLFLYNSKTSAFSRRGEQCIGGETSLLSLFLALVSYFSYLVIGFFFFFVGCYGFLAFFFLIITSKKNILARHLTKNLELTSSIPVNKK
jgi:hypothetical protein